MRRKLMSRSGLIWLMAATIGCEAGPDAPDAPDAIADPPPPTRACNVLTPVCLLPWPSSVFEVVDTEQPSGRSLFVDPSVGIPTAWSKIAALSPDGFSPVGAIVTTFERPFSEASLPTPEGSTEVTSAIYLFDADARSPDRGERLPFKAERRLSTDESQDLLFLLPLRALEPGRRYGVAIRRSLLGQDGQSLEPGSAMRALLDSDAAEPRRDADAALRLNTQNLLGILEADGLERGDLVALWDFRVRSSEGITADLDAVIDHNKGFISAQGPMEIIGESDAGDGATRYDVRLRIPRFRSDRDALLNRDPSGVVKPIDEVTLNAILVVSGAATPERPAIPVLFGHGLSASAELMYGQLIPRLSLDLGPYAVLLVDWDLHGQRGQGLTDILAISGALNAGAFAHSMVQSTGDALIFADLLTRVPELPGRGRVVAPAPVFFLGQSLGSMIGLLLSTVDSPIHAAVQNVPGGALATILRKGEVTSRLGLRTTIEAALDAEPISGLSRELGVDVLLAISQIGLDVGDPLSHVSTHRRPRHPQLLQESIGDGIVPNEVTELLARTMGLPLVTPAIRPVPIITLAASPLRGAELGALVQFRTSADAFTAHVSLFEPTVAGHALSYLQTFADDDADNDGEISLDCEGPCDLVR